MRSCTLVLLLVSHVAAADDTEVRVAGAPPIAVRPPAGVDPDVAQRFDEADALLSTDAARALERVLVLYQADDAFSRAQGERAKPRALALLGRIGSRARGAGDLVLAARAFDARWILSGERVDRELAAVLADWSAREQEASPGRALYLARRAHRADPDLVTAARLDAELSSNRRIWKARAIVLAGLAAFGGGLYASYTGHDNVATGLYVASPILCAGGILFGVSGIPGHSPTSPMELPSVGDRR